MVWFKVDDAFHSHRKTIAAGNAAIGLWARCGSWSSDQGHDGFVPREVALHFGNPRLVAQLIQAGLWHEADGGYQFHDFTDYNPLAEQVEQLREARRQAGSRGGKRTAAAKQQASKVQASAQASAAPVAVAQSNPVPEPVPKGSKEPFSARKRAVPPPDIMPITNEMRAWAEEHAPDVRLVVQTAKLLDWARGKGEKKQDWVAAWRNWMRSEQERLNSTPNRKAGIGNGVYDDDEEVWMR